MSLCLLLDAGEYSLVEGRIGGIGLRIAEFAQTLSERFAVRVAVGDTADVVSTGAGEVVSRSDWDALIRTADAVFFFDLPDRAHLESAVAHRKVIICENAAPIEQLEYPSIRGSRDPIARHSAMVADYRRQLEVSHHFLVRSRVERATLATNLCLAGRLHPETISRSRTADHLITLVPIGFGAQALSREAAAAAEPTADALWTGGLWTYFAPELLVEAVALCHREGLPVTAEFLHARPGPDTEEIVRRLRQQVRELKLTNAIRFETADLSLLERARRIRGTRILVSVARPGLENETCVRLRARDSRLHGKPAIVDPFGATATELSADGLAVVPPDASAEQLAAALAAAAQQPSGPEPETLHQRYRYDNTLAPFMAWLEGAA
ncbi:hypothetical protein [Nocardia sp. Marseille-Q1738]